MKFIDGGVTAAQGFSASGIHCGIRKNRSKLDLALIVSERECAAAGVYTQNVVKGGDSHSKEYRGWQGLGGDLQLWHCQYLCAGRHGDSGGDVPYCC